MWIRDIDLSTYPGFNTLEEMENFFYGGGTPLSLDQATGKLIFNVQQADEFVTTTTPNWVDVMYGQRLQWQFTTQVNLFRLLTTKPWPTSGFRTVEDIGSRPPTGVPETGAVPDAGHPDVNKVNYTPKLMSAAYGYTMVAEALQGKDDVVPLQVDQEACERYLKKDINTNLCADLHTSQGNNMCSVDKIIASYDYVTNNARLSPTDGNFANIDRSTGPSVYDSNVLHNSGTPRNLDLDLLKSLYDACKVHWDDPNDVSGKIWLTASATRRRWESLMEDRQMYFGTEYIEVTRNGVKTVGRDTGFEVATFCRIPIFEEEGIYGDPLPHTYLIDTNDLHVSQLIPWTHISANNPILLGFFGTKSAYVMAGETVCEHPNWHGKIVDLQ